MWPHRGPVVPIGDGEVGEVGERGKLWHSQADKYRTSSDSQYWPMDAVSAYQGGRSYYIVHTKADRVTTLSVCLGMPGVDSRVAVVLCRSRTRTLRGRLTGFRGGLGVSGACGTYGSSLSSSSLSSSALPVADDGTPPVLPGPILIN